MLIQPGNYGWPFCVTRDMPYVDYDFATGESGEPFDCRRPVNDSALNTGRRVLPPLVQPDVWSSTPPSTSPTAPAAGLPPRW